MARWVFGSTLAAAMSLSGAAFADTATWFHVGGGAMGFQEASDTELTLAATMAAEAGVGTTVHAPVSFGGLFRVQPVFEHGVDLDLYLRFCNHSFMTGPVGFAIDAGGYARFWGVQSAGFSGQLILGGPLGLQLSALGQYGSGGSFAFGGVLGFDLARLIVHRETLLDWWQNPRPDDAMQTAFRW
jgi:hypothetical protein